jgi:hypothetical protein
MKLQRPLRHSGQCNNIYSHFKCTLTRSKRESQHTVGHLAGHHRQGLWDGAPPGSQFFWAETWQAEPALHRGTLPSCPWSAHLSWECRVLNPLGRESCHKARPLLLGNRVPLARRAHAGGSPLILVYLLLSVGGHWRVALCCVLSRCPLDMIFSRVFPLWCHLVLCCLVTPKSGGPRTLLETSSHLSISIAILDTILVACLISPVHINGVLMLATAVYL